MIVWVAPASRGFRDTTRERGRVLGGTESGAGSGRARRRAAARPWLLTVQRDGAYARVTSLRACLAHSSLRRADGGCVCVRACVRERAKRERARGHAPNIGVDARALVGARGRASCADERAAMRERSRWRPAHACPLSHALARAARSREGQRTRPSERASERWCEVARARVGTRVRRACASACTILRVVVTSLRARARATRARGPLSGASHFSGARWCRRWTRRPPRRRWRRRAGHRRRASR